MKESCNIHDIKFILGHHVSGSCEELTLDTRIGEDLCIIGDDAEEFLFDYAQEYGVDFSKFEFGDYFPDEGSIDMHYYISNIVKYKSSFIGFVNKIDSFFWRAIAQRRNYKSMTINDLIVSARAGKWTKG